MNRTTEKILLEIKSIFVIILIALSLRATVIEAYIVPTGSMENTIMTGDFLIGNKFAYGMRTPDWIGIPYTELGFPVPWTRFPAFKKPRQGDVVIFKFPRDQFQKYVKRLIAEPGQTVEVREKRVMIDGQEYSLPPLGKFVHNYVFPPEQQRDDMFLRQGGNRDNFGPVHVPQEGDVIKIDENVRWDFLLPIMMLDGHDVALSFESREITFTFTMDDPKEIERRYLSGLLLKLRRSITGRAIPPPRKISRMSRNYYHQDYSPGGRLMNVWTFPFEEFGENVINHLRFDGQPIESLNSYTVEQDYYWMMGDNRDDSADSRYWGFVPRDLILGEAVIVYMSLDFRNGGPLKRIGKIIS